MVFHLKPATRLFMLKPLLAILLFGIVLTACSNPDARDEKRRTALIVAAEQGELVKVEQLLKRAKMAMAGAR